MKKQAKVEYCGHFLCGAYFGYCKFSCTGPIVGTPVGQTSTEGVSLAPVLGMLAQGLAFAAFLYLPLSFDAAGIAKKRRLA